MTSYVASANKFMTDQNVLEELLNAHPKQREHEADVLALMKRAGVRSSPLQLTATNDKLYKGSYSVIFQYRNGYGSPLISFGLDFYPHCCALHQLNGFHTIDNYVDPEFFEAFVEKCITIYSQTVQTPRRLMINFVEWSRAAFHETTDVDIPLSDQSQIAYPLFYTWAKKKPHIETLFVNHNTTRIIHNTIITL